MKTYHDKRLLLLDMRLIANKWNGRANSLGTAELILLKDLYSTVYVKPSMLFPNNPVRTALIVELSEMNSCSACLKKIVAHLLGYWDENKHLIGQ